MIEGLPRRIHCVGVGGGGLSALARLLAEQGHEVSGSDRAETSAALQAHGVDVHIGHEAAALGAAQLVVRSAAVPDDNPELEAARSADVPILKYSEAIGRLMGGRPGIAVSGTHGKTTTTALLAHLLRGAGADPGWMVGGRPLTLPVPGAWGRADGPFVAEACEYDDSFLNLAYDVGVVLGVSADHLDWFGDEGGVHAAFRRFARRVPEDGTLVLGDGVPDTLDLGADCAGRTLRAAEHMRLVDVVEGADGYHGRIESPEGGGPFRCPLLGRHNLGNLQVALTAACAVGVPLADLAPHVAGYTGVGRRLQAVGRVAEGRGTGALVIDDFAHHPEELRASADAVRRRFPGRRLVAVYQPHQVCRTEDFMDGFAEALGRFDRVLLCDIFVARDRHPERADQTSRTLVSRIPGDGVTRVGPAVQARSEVLSALRPDDVCLVMGAGDIDGLARGLAGAPAGS